MRIGILGHSFVTWGGGLAFVALIARALAEAEPSAELHVFLPLRGRVKRARELNELARFAAKRILRRGLAAKHDPPSEHIVLEAFRSLRDRVQVHVMDEGYRALGNALEVAAIDVVLPAIDPLPASFGVPWLGYMYDFQHRYFPELSTEKEIRRRDEKFHEMSTIARAIVVNSKKTRSDITTFFPDATAKVFTLPFAPCPEPDWLANNDEVTKLCSPPYFIICNQFWMHKDHRTAIRAFRRVAKEHPHVNLVCTGSLNDYRAPGYIPDLLNEIERSGVGSRVKLLGMISKQSQIQLLKHSLALIQPTLFEGGPGGGATYDAVALGVPVFLSDIEVNLEVDCGDVRFFEARNDSHLANLMREFLKRRHPPKPDPEVLLRDGRERLARCGSVLLDALRFVHKPTG